MKKKARSKNEPPVPIAAESEDQSIDQVRNILFGAQTRQFDQRLAQMDDKFNKQLAELRNETLRMIDSLETYVKKEVSSLADDLRNEGETRSEAVDKLAQAASTLEKGVREKNPTARKKTDGQPASPSGPDSEAIQRSSRRDPKTVR